MQRPFLQRIVPYLFVAPHFVFFLTFMVVPTFLGLWISFHKWDFLAEPKWVGWRNYLNLFDPETIQYEYFWPALLNTFKFVLFSVPLLILVPLLLALALNTQVWLKGLFRSIFFAPVILSIASVGIIWRFFLDTQAGLLNYWLGTYLKIDSIAWLTTIPWAWVSIVLVTIWWTSGSNMVLFLAGLQDIPEHLYEAGRIDGATRWDLLLRITLPLLRPTLLFVTVMTTLASFNIFGQPYMLTGGGPSHGTRMVLMLIREEAFSAFRMGSASAMAYILGIIMIVVSIGQFKWLRDNIEY